MACHKGWSREILVNNFTQKFVSHGYKARRESLLLEREKSLMPATQPYVEIERQVRRITSDIAHKRKELEGLNHAWGKIESLPLGPLAVENGLVHEFDALILRHKMGQDHRKMVSNVMIDIQHMEWWQERLMMRLHGDTIDHEKRQFVRACPAPECRGFLSTSWKCGVCDNWACPECHEVKGANKDDPHTCDPNSVETAKLLAKDSRHCPKCAAIIFKIDGCDQMYCTQCHTAFSWRTGRIETGVIHNPHYYEYHRQRGTLQRNPGDVPCGGFPAWHTIQALTPRTHHLYLKIANAHRTYAHCMWVVTPRYTTGNGDNRDLRIKLMIGDISEDEFKRKIQQREKARQRKTEIVQVLEMFTTVLNDLFQAYVNDKNIDAIYVSLNELRAHFTNTMKAVSKRYTNCATPTLTENFDMY